MKIANYVVRRLILASTLLSLLGGCAIYGTTRPHYSSGGAVYYSAPGPIYASPPAPVYVDPWPAGPPVFLNFGFRSWSGQGHHHRHRGWQGDGRRGGDGWHNGGRGGYHGHHRGHGGRAHRR